MQTKVGTDYDAHLSNIVGTRIVPGYCKHIEVDAENRSTIATFNFMTPKTDLDVFRDTEFAGCMRTMRSTSGGVAIVGEHVLNCWSKTQAVVALSSAEADITGLREAAGEGLGDEGWWLAATSQGERLSGRQSGAGSEQWPRRGASVSRPRIACEQRRRREKAPREP